MRSRNDAADRAGRGWDALLAGRPPHPEDGVEFAKTIAALHGGDDAPPVNPMFVDQLSNKLFIEPLVTREVNHMDQSIDQSAGPARPRQLAQAHADQDRWPAIARRRHGFKHWFAIAAVLAILLAIGGGVINRDRFNHTGGETGIDAAQIAAPASPTSAIKARLIMFVRTCPAGYDVTNPSANPSVDCASIATGVPFTLSGNGIIPMTHKVITQGSWVDYAPLEAGRYLLTEAMPAGVTSAFLDGCVSANPAFSNFPFVPMARIGADGKLILNILDGDKFMCNWYNVPAMTPATPVS